MNILLVAFFAFLFVIGLLMVISSVASYSNYVSTRGKITDYLKCNPSDKQIEALEKAERQQEAEAALVVYTVSGENFSLATRNKKALQGAGHNGEVDVLYNPYDPKDARIKEEGSPFMGAAFMAVAGIGIILVVIL